MRDEFKQTKNYIRSLQSVHQCCLDIFNGVLANNEQYADKMLSECECTIDGLYSMDENNAPGVWPVIIQELLESVEYSDQLQSVYDKWIRLVSDGVRIYSKDELKWLLGKKNIDPDSIEPDTAIGRCYKMLCQSRNIMYALWCRIQDLKLEYDLHDTDDYNLSLAFRAFYNVIEYPNGPEDDDTNNSDENDFSSSFEEQSIPDKVRWVFPDIEQCKQFLKVDCELTPTQWGKRLKKFAKPRKDWEKGYINNVFNYLTTLFPYLTEKNRCTFQKGTI